MRGGFCDCLLSATGEFLLSEYDLRKTTLKMYSSATHSKRGEGGKKSPWIWVVRKKIEVAYLIAGGGVIEEKKEKG